MATTLTTYHVKPRDDGWAVEAEGSTRPSAVESRKSDAVARGREIAENQQPAKLVIHKQDGSVQDEVTYGDLDFADGDTAVREGRFAAADAAYALAALANDALQLANEALQIARTLPEKAQERAKDLKELRARRDEIEQRVEKMRDTAEQRLGEKVSEGRGLAQTVLSDERVRRLVDQAKTAQSQVKGALTSIRRIGDEAASSAVRAGRDQAGTAKSQTKAAATSVRKTAEEAVEAGRRTASN